ncbi:winged helix-turn-helix domain-containing protein [Mycolicibacterium rhodesiae]|uniref:Response regulator with CheY-like receiver domain and winged-helix DNA-binding domain n=1 Tax=Mycolicibacterium rhodesiae TaxID=36814 RepID=A0A1X0IVL2_MYCRH|nr:winged helix-turn-helix domain-containing protein [Mycolicibacterium rhodesiae]MCV7346001.1 winged-helix domain-containing protein [Mycolicibacterium rhodesiae]ORB52455.1 hypothetical protein BST42_15150 [Mycolicibacterium rhodesiae]
MDNRDASTPAALAVTLIGNHASWMEAIVDYFRRDEVHITLVDDHARALHIVERNQPSFIAFDTDDLDAAALETCRNVRAIADSHITICCTRGDEAAVVAGLAAGADDVLTGRHTSRELAARIRAVQRRRRSAASAAIRRGSAPGQYTCGSMVIDVTRRQVYVGADHVNVTRTQFDILVELARRGGAVTTREELVAAVWGARQKANLDTMTTHVRQLRRRLGEDSERPVFVISVRGVGYRLGPKVKAVDLTQ